MKVSEVPLMTLSLAVLAGGCTWFTYSNCPEWDACSRPCGGGIQYRVCRSCFWEWTKTFYQGCIGFCYNGGIFWNSQCVCRAWRSGRCCEDCKHVVIDNCLPGHQECGGSPDGIRCTQCQTGYHPAGYGLGCKACGNYTVNHCLPGKTECSGSSSDVIKCLECEGGYVSDGTRCIEITDNGKTTELATTKNDTNVTDDDDDYDDKVALAVTIVIPIISVITFFTIVVCCLCDGCYGYKCRKKYCDS
ncbi:hypothetical protein DPMN_093488 [Dreissena polymorpha]|uniref:Uncharacterized protein n=1 Tax=Dreissena polymorpha TaxID=45954 RepID=A0A9D4R0Y1_DREPO|nr:hypothetical protein DPMN_093488 [Dreissena polymorpha]